MSDPWDEAPLAEDPWDAAPTVDEALPPATKSEKQLRDLSMFGGRFDPVAVGETALTIGSGIYDTISKGVAGAIGVAGGMVPGGESPSEKGARFLELSEGTFQYEPRTQGGQAGVEGVSKLAELGEKGVKFVGSGYAAMAGGAEAQKNFMETDNAMAEGVFQVTQSPTMAAVTQILPEIASMGVPAARFKPKATPVRPEMDIADIPEGYGGVGEPRPIPETGRRAPDPEVPGPDVYDEIQSAIKRGDKKKLMEMVNANPAIVQAFDELGIEFTPGMVSDNPALRQVEAGMQSVPGSPLAQTTETAVTEIQKKARQLIDDSGGNSQSKAAIGDDIQREFESTRQQLLDETEGYWDELRREINPAQEIDLTRAAEELEDIATRLGKGDIDRGLSRMSRHERELWDLTHRRIRDADGNVTYEYDAPPYDAVDRYRRKLGLGMENRGPFNDAGTAELDHWYGQMAETQGRVAQGGGYGELWDNMNSSVQTRKQLESAMQRTFGQRLQNSVINKIESSTRNLLGGKTNQWDELFNDLPPAQRQAAAATALDTVMFTAGKGTKMSESFVANFQKIKRDPRLRDRIFDELPMEARSQFMNIGEAATGFYRAMEKLNRSNTANANAVIQGIESGTLVRRLFGGTRSAAERVPFFGDLFKRAADQTPSEIKRGRVKAAADLLADPDFRRAITEYAAGRVEEAEKILRGASTYEGWARTLTSRELAGLEAAGVLTALTQLEDDE